MAKKLNLTSISGGYFTQTQLNENFAAIEDAVDNTVSRDGSIPNQMEADLDMNSNDILNVNNIYTDNLILGGSATLPALVSRSQETQTPGAGILTLTVNEYYVGNDSITIHVDGLKQVIDIDYIEVGSVGDISTSVTFTSPFAGTETVDIVVDATYQKGECSANPAIVNWISLADYICDGLDADTALSTALSDCCSNNRALYIPAGTYTFSAPGVITNCDISIFGDGPALTVLKFDGCDGFQFNYTTTDHFRAQVSDMSILQEDEGTYIAITLSNTSGSTGEGYHTLFSNLDFMYRVPATGNFTNHSWKTGISIQGVSDGTIEKCIFLSNNTVYDTAFIRFTDDEETFRWSITGNSIGWCNKAIELDTSATAFHEGVTIMDNDADDIDYFVYHVYSTGDLNIQRIEIASNYAFCGKDCINISALLPDIHDNILVHDQTVYGSTNGQYSCVYLTGETINGLVHDNQMGTDTGGSYTVNGVTIDGSEAASIKYVSVHKNVFNYGYIGVLIENNVESCNWDDNMYGADITTKISDTTASSNRNYHENGASTHYRTDAVVDITTAVSIPTAYQIPFTYFDNSKDELDLTPVTTATVTIPEHIDKLRVTALVIIRSDAVPAPGTTLNMNIMGTDVDGEPLADIIGAIELPAPANGDYQTLAANAAVVNVVAGSTIYVRVWSSAALAKSTIRADLWLENVT